MVRGGWLSPHGSLSHIRDWRDMGDLPLIAEAYYNARSQNARSQTAVQAKEI